MADQMSFRNETWSIEVRQGHFLPFGQQSSPKNFVQMQVNLFVFPALQVELPCQGGEFQILRNEDRHLQKKHGACDIRSMTVVGRW